MKAVLVALLLALSGVGLHADDSPTLADGQKAVQAQDFVGAALILEVVTEREPQNARAWQLLGYSLHAQGRLDEALAAHTTAAGFPATASLAAYNAACACALLGRADDAFAWLGKAKAAGHNLAAARTDPDFASIRQDARFTALFPSVLSGAALFVEQPRILYTLVGEVPGDQFGWVGRIIGDVDGDGVLDFATSSPSHKSGGISAGRVYLYSGKAGQLLWTMDGAIGETLGSGVAPAGDVNADGVPDVIAGAPGRGPSGQRAGEARVFSGKDGALLLTLSAGEPTDGFGTKVCSLGDLDGDGHAELLVGALNSNAGGPKSGRAYAFSGKDGAQLFAIDAESAGDGFGSAVDSTTSGDERLVAIGAMTAGPTNTGRVYVYRVTIEGAELAFTIDGDKTAATLGQYFVAIAGDVDADGVEDVFSTDFNNSARGSSTGRAYVHSGKTGELLRTFTGTVPGEGFGTSRSIAGDVNRDGHADFIVGAWQHASSAPSGGRCYLLSGKDGSELARYTCKQAGDTFGFDAVGIGDVDGDGGVDFLLTSAWSPALGPKTGRVFVIAGPTFED